MNAATDRTDRTTLAPELGLKLYELTRKRFDGSVCYRADDQYGLIFRAFSDNDPGWTPLRHDHVAFQRTIDTWLGQLGPTQRVRLKQNNDRGTKVAVFDRVLVISEVLDDDRVLRLVPIN